VGPAVKSAIDLVSLRVAHPLGGSSWETSESQLIRINGSRCDVLVDKEWEDEMRFRRQQRLHV